MYSFRPSFMYSPLSPFRTSYEANRVCHDRILVRMTEYHAGTEWEDTWDMSDNAVISLLPSHYFSTFSTFVSLVSFLIWLFYSPYIALVDAEGLDRKREHLFNVPVGCSDV